MIECHEMIGTNMNTVQYSISMICFPGLNVQEGVRISVRGWCRHRVCDYVYLMYLWMRGCVRDVWDHLIYLH